MPPRAVLRSSEQVSGTGYLTYKSRKAARRAFTLIELLMVIVIIGILVALVTLAASSAITKAKQTAVITEISQLSMALDSYKQKHGSYPPNPGTEPTPAAAPVIGKETVAQRGQRLERHLRRAFPRYTGTIANAETQIRGATAGLFPAPLDNGLELTSLDGAEAMVFFLGGLPNPSASYPLTGFAADPSQPFQRSTIFPGDPPAGPFTQPFQAQRTQRFFEFDPTRLVDRDQDGWPEYVPKLKTTVVETAPYVYFDAGSYHLGSHYPWQIDFTQSPPEHTDTQLRLAGLWGFAVPYGSARDTTVGSATNPTTWRMSAFQEPDKFQIICAGLDGQFGGREEPISSFDEAWKRIFPTGEGYKNFNGGAPPAGYLDLDSDNMTNFAEKPIGEVEAPTSP